MQFDELFDYPAFWEQIWFNSKRKDRDLPEPVKLHQPHLIPGTVALADITEQTRVYHYTTPCWHLISVPITADKWLPLVDCTTACINVDYIGQRDIDKMEPKLIFLNASVVK